MRCVNNCMALEFYFENFFYISALDDQKAQLDYFTLVEI